LPFRNVGFAAIRQRLLTIRNRARRLHNLNLSDASRAQANFSPARLTQFELRRHVRRLKMKSSLRLGITAAAFAAFVFATLIVPRLAAAPDAAGGGVALNRETDKADRPQTLTAETPGRGEAAKGRASERADAAERTDAADRIREGTRWQNERGIFTLVGDRVTFTPNSLRNQNFMVLENLNLERIVRTIEENRTVTDADTLEWNIDGTVTEFRGGNFVLVTRSVLVARPRSTDAGR
jgi:hypothetical protein